VREQVDADLAEGSTFGIELEDFRTRTCNNDVCSASSSSYRQECDRLCWSGTTTTVSPFCTAIISPSRTSQAGTWTGSLSRHFRFVCIRTCNRSRAAHQDSWAEKTRQLACQNEKARRGWNPDPCPVVLMPGINDGAHLEQTVADLYGFYPGVNSVAIVPLDFRITAGRVMSSPRSPWISAVRPSRRLRHGSGGTGASAGMDSFIWQTSFTYRGDYRFRMRVLMTISARLRMESGWCGGSSMNLTIIWQDGASPGDSFTARL